MLHELDPCAREFVNVRRFVEFAAVGAGIRPPHVIGEDENDVGSFGVGFLCKKDSGKHEEQGGDEFHGNASGTGEPC